MLSSWSKVILVVIKLVKPFLERNEMEWRTFSNPPSKLDGLLG
jgi:hypothetical protein